MLRTGFIDGTMVAPEEGTAAVRLIQQGELLPVRCDARVVFDKSVLGKLQMTCQPCDVGIVEQNGASPPAALPAAGALKPL